MESQLRNDFAKVRDEYGLIQPGNGSGGNGLRYTSDYLLILKRLGFCKTDDINDFEQVTKRCRAGVIPGCYNRSPVNTDQEGPDDYVALAAADRDIAFDIFTYGVNNNWIYCNVEPGIKYNWTWEVFRRYVLGKKDRTHRLSALFFRQPQLIAHFYYAASFKCPLWRKLAWFLSIWYTSFSETKGQDDWVLSNHLIITYLMSSQRTWYQDWVCNYWGKQFKKTWPGGFKELLTKYFGWEHPLAKYSD